MGMIDMNGTPRTSRRNRAYAAIAGKKYSETLPPGYRSVVFTNNSGHYILVRLGGVDAPTDPASAERVVPPFHSAGIALTGSMVGIGVVDTVASFAVGLATGADGVCDAVYSSDPITEYNTPMAGATSSVGVAAPATGVYLTASVFGAMDSTAQYLQVLDGGAAPSLHKFLRYAKAAVTLDESIDITQGFAWSLLLRPTSDPPTPPFTYLSAGKIAPGYVPTIEYGPAAPGGDIAIPYGWGLYVHTAAPLSAAGTVFGLAEYRQAA